MTQARIDRIAPRTLGGIRAPREVPLPAMVRVSQRWPTPGRCDVDAEIHRRIDAPEIARRIPKGGRVAVAVGSRGVAEIDRITAAVVAAVKRHGATPFVFPAMGSHGGATAEGQVEVLAALGVTEARIGAPIASAMEVVELGRLADGSGVYWDRNAHAADAVVVVGRVKPHTLFRGPIESGLIKMSVIGAGKQRGAMSIHATGPNDLGPRLLEAWPIVREKTPLAFGVAVVEDAYDIPVEIAVVPSEAFLEREPALLARARDLMPSLPVRDIDVLIVQEIGKNISGDGMDPNITGRYLSHVTGGPTIRRIVVLDLTEETHGNATGIGMADLTVRRVVDKIDLESTYTNGITAAITEGSRLPVIMVSDRDAIWTALLTTQRPTPPGTERIVYIRSTLALGEVAVSTALVSHLAAHAKVASPPLALGFSDDGTLVSPLAAAVGARTV
ncbi:MAG TPA: lactate racemase domain-containing protein [bacterium]|nr:lactate racemase domain-containing protein [bacterium]